MNGPPAMLLLLYLVSRADVMVAWYDKGAIDMPESMPSFRDVLMQYIYMMYVTGVLSGQITWEAKPD